ncbi:hypothetical protein GQ43DRAFT_442236 [Delitschia confertaspora ATCC 74209]|uniref:N-acetylgalactosaminide beta-1,3-galactosyltransferase n=1 Tax=Delitschia confertaspora ATCC 74209 TaxID=1513339 RepID=A0A9P4JM79_9PLEO|nr:hypothetical protein GQ43DRAFT_442236 [Delitschia confertaspora ATCC 74209]
MVRLFRVRTLLLAVACFIILSFFGTPFLPSLPGRRGYDYLRDLPVAAKTSVDGLCDSIPASAFDNIQVVLKVGTAEVGSMLPTYLGSVLSCIPDPLIFSDHQEKAFGHTIFDALGYIPKEMKADNPDYEIYQEIQNLKKENATLEKNNNGWKLDKYKFLPMMELASALKPQKSWYFFVELDTYVNWENLLRFLQSLNPSKALYIGSPVWPPNKPVFAHGGSGFILSQTALQRLSKHGENFRTHGRAGSHQFGLDMTQECCGDEVLAKVLSNIGITNRGYWPMFNGETPSTVRFGSEQWCEAIVTLHHMHDRDFEDLRRFERDRPTPAKPLMFEELFKMIEPSIAPQVANWTNLSEDVKFSSPDPPAGSVEACHEACLKDKNCVQYVHQKDFCQLGNTIRLGHEKVPEGDIVSTSGWMKDRIETFKRKYSPCKDAHMVHSNP